MCFTDGALALWVCFSFSLSSLSVFFFVSLCAALLRFPHLSADCSEPVLRRAGQLPLFSCACASGVKVTYDERSEKRCKNKREASGDIDDEGPASQMSRRQETEFKERGTFYHSDAKMD